MARIAQTIDVNASPDIAYRELTRFEEYPQFISDVIEVRREDERHLHWRATLAGHDVSWEMEITDSRPGQGFAWRGLRFPHEGRVDVTPSGNGARIAVSIDGDFSLPQDNAGAILSQRLQQDLVRFKRHLESRHGARAAHAAASASASSAAASSSSYAAGSEGGDGNEDPGMAVVSSTPDNAGQLGRGSQPQSTGLQPGNAEQGQAAGAATQSSSSLSRMDALAGIPKDESGFRVAEEVSLDQQSPQARRVGQMPEAPVGAPVSGGASPADAMAQSMRGGAESQGAAARPQDPAAGTGAEKESSQSTHSAHSAHAGSGRQQSSHASEPSWLPNLMQAIEEPMAAMRKMSGEVDQLFERFVGRPMFGGRAAQPAGAAPDPQGAERGEARSEWMPVVEVSRQGDKVVVCAELPGVQRKDVHVEVQHDALIIEGERHDEAQGVRGDRLHSERSYGHFYRMISLPRGIDPDAASAAMHDGVLQVTLPIRSAPTQGRRLDIGG
ncbi:Molecular chaperone IbpA, HSP20 family [Noviherbaspirillum humi]|uniref:Molecular chaperone IbpA, HSP20 family n=1 Tax=Noviherbaspirillum humi TaxID=1688639 RepID=A0A239DTG5_9BURK|nr:Hsp20 family protein [Noviherbaspirillum humi]SNS35391.1 Molecular chaperone IbpA, HSP20 family [Noviherbaspirillum humi]